LLCAVSLDGDKIGIRLDVKPCAEPEAYVNVAVTEANHNLSYSIAGIKAGQEEDIPLPGVSIDIPKVGNAGVDVAVELGGNLDALTISVGVDACVGVGPKEVCGHALAPKLLPIWLLEGTFHFGSLCGNSTVQVAPVLVV